MAGVLYFIFMLFFAVCGTSWLGVLYFIRMLCYAVCAPYVWVLYTLYVCYVM